MVALDELEVSAAHREVMGGVVGEIVDQIADDKAGENRRNPLRSLEKQGEEHIEYAVENGCKGDGNHGRHHQARLYLRLGVVNPVEEEHDAFGFFTFHRHMKQEAVQQILRNCPQENPEQETERDGRWKSAGGSLHDGVDEKIKGNGQPDDHDNNRADVGKELEKIGLEQSNRDITIVGW